MVARRAREVRLRGVVDDHACPEALDPHLVRPEIGVGVAPTGHGRIQGAAKVAAARAKALRRPGVQRVRQSALSRIIQADEQDATMIQTEAKEESAEPPRYLQEYVG